MSRPFQEVVVVQILILVALSSCSLLVQVIILCRDQPTPGAPRRAWHQLTRADSLGCLLLDYVQLEYDLVCCIVLD